MNSYRGGGFNPQSVIPFTPAVKALVITNVVIWFVVQLVFEQMILREPWVTVYLGLVPEFFINKFYVWQPLTYMFLHSVNPFHILFNMLMLWWLGSELEGRWGSKYFLCFYFASGIGAGLIYAFGLFAASFFSLSAPMALAAPVVGASGAIFGLLLAYGIIFGERVVVFMMLFPMKAKYFVMILGAIEAVTLVNNGGRSNVANLAHLGGIVSGYLFLKISIWWQQGVWRKKALAKMGRSGRGLKLVVDNEKKKKDEPRYWN